MVTSSFFATCAIVFVLCSARALADQQCINNPADNPAVIYGYTTEIATAVNNTASFTYPKDSPVTTDVFTSNGYHNGVRYDLAVYGSDVIDGITTLEFMFNVSYQQFPYGTGAETAATGLELFAPLECEACGHAGRDKPFRFYDFEANEDYNQRGKAFIKKQIGNVNINTGTKDMTHVHFALARGGFHNRMEIHRLSQPGKSDADAAAFYVSQGYPVAWNFTAWFYGPAFGCQKDIVLAYVPQYLERPNTTIQALRALLAAGEMYTENVLETLTFNPGFFACLQGQCTCPDGLYLPSGKRSIPKNVLPQLPHKFARKIHEDRHMPKDMTIVQKNGLAALRRAHKQGTTHKIAPIQMA